LVEVFWTNKCGSSSRPDEEEGHGKGLNREKCRDIISSNDYIWTIKINYDINLLIYWKQILLMAILNDYFSKNNIEIMILVY